MFNLTIYFNSMAGNMYSITPYLSGNGYHVDMYSPVTKEYKSWEGCEVFPQYIYNACTTGTDHEVCTHKRTKLSPKQASKILEYMINRTQVN